MISPFLPRARPNPQAALTDAGRATHGRLDQDLRDDQGYLASDSSSPVVEDRVSGAIVTGSSWNRSSVRSFTDSTREPAANTTVSCSMTSGSTNVWMPNRDPIGGRAPSS
jgi:hypothetical protein